MPKTKCLLLAVAFCCLLGFSPALRAQESASASGGGQATPADTYNKLLSIMEKQIVSAADAMPAEKYNFVPTQGEFKGVRTFGDQVKHLAQANYEFFEGWNVPGSADPKTIDKLTSKDDIMKALKDSYTYAHAAVSTITAENAFTQMGEHKSTRAGMASFCAAHSMDHYGQMVVYLRMNGIVPPASRQSGM